MKKMGRSRTGDNWPQIIWMYYMGVPVFCRENFIKLPGDPFGPRFVMGTSLPTSLGRQLHGTDP